ncbi:MAG: GNAT family N-acetyltransferase [Acidimicrobiia bacterium]|nr:GNAT family N-acetyltransferase [Acidimicrobiia bacterium]
MSASPEIEVRIARPEDADGIVALVNHRIGEEDGPEARLTLDDPRFGPGGWTVAVAGDRVVSTLGLFSSRTHIGSVVVPSSAIEFVATATEFEGRGLVRRQLELVHRISSERGDLVQWMVGIPYFYRRFGYEYAVPTPDTIDITPPIPGGADDVTFRMASIDDLDHILALQDHAASSAMMVAEHDGLMWSWLIASPVYRVIVAERGDRPVGMMRTYDDDGTTLVFDLSAADPGTFRSLIGEAGRVGGGVTIAMRPGFEDFAADLPTRTNDGYAYYARVPKPADLLEAIRPELNLRLTGSGLEVDDGELLLSLYRESMRLAIEKGRLGPVATGGRVQAPVSAGGSGVPPDLIAHLILGPLGALELERRHADVLLGQQRRLMDALFPPQTVDVQSWVWP